jgi:hypothetical protein
MIQRLPFAPIANPGAASRATVYDSATAALGDAENRGRVEVMAYIDQDFALNTYWAKDDASPLRLVRSDSFVGGEDDHVLPVRAAKPITVVAKASLVNNDYFAVARSVTISGLVDDLLEVVFEYQVDDTFEATEGRVTIDVQEATTDVEVAVLTAAAIAGNATLAPLVDAPEPDSATLTVTNKISGPAYVIGASEHVANAGFSVGSATAGVDGTLVRFNHRLPVGRTVIYLDTGTAPGEFDVRAQTIDDWAAGA